MADEKLERARNHCFFGGVDDSGGALCAANVPYGIAKIQHVQKRLGYPADAGFVASPDATITRNISRWQQGFGYGGVYQWTGDFHPLDIKVNACGMMVGTLPAAPDIDDVKQKLRVLDAEGLTMDGVALDNDLGEANHFIDILENGSDSNNPAPGTSPAAADLPTARHYFIMHSSGHEHRKQTARGLGLYWDKSDALAKAAETFDTPWGVLRVLRGDALAEWFAFYRDVQDFNHRRRAFIAEFLFGDHDDIVNATHQGLVRGHNIANIGCYTFEDDADAQARLFPLTLSPELPAFLVRGRRSIDEATLERCGWAERADQFDLLDRLRSTNLLPHGGGYTYPQLRGVARVLEDGPDSRRFELVPTDPQAQVETITAPRSLPYQYRGLEVAERMEELDLGERVLELTLTHVLKT